MLLDDAAYCCTNGHEASSSRVSMKVSNKLWHHYVSSRGGSVVQHRNNNVLCSVESLMAAGSRWLLRWWHAINCCMPIAQPVVP